MAEEPKREDKDARETGEKNLWDKIKGHSRSFEEFLRERGLDNIGILRRWDKIKGYLLDNPTLALTLLYLYVTAIGMFYSAVLYGRFGINVFDYSEISDFLLAAFKNPVVLVLPGLQFAGYYATGFVGAGLSRRRERRRMERRHFERERRHEAAEGNTSGEIRTEEELEEETRKPSDDWTRSSKSLRMDMFVSAFVFVLGLTIVGAIGVANSIKNGDKPTMDLRYRSFSDSAGQVTEPNLTLIGATQKAVFFYDVDKKHTIVIPQSQIVSIEVPEQD